MIEALLLFLAAVLVVLGLLFVLFAPLAGMLFVLDTIARWRGLPGAHPLSPAVAGTLLVWAILACAGMTVAIGALSGAQP